MYQILISNFAYLLFSVYVFLKPIQNIYILLHFYPLFCIISGCQDKIIVLQTLVAIPEQKLTVLFSIFGSFSNNRMKYNDVHDSGACASL
jgi:hypothetical protein